MKTFDLNRFGKTYTIQLKAGVYYYGGNLYIEMLSLEDDDIEPWSDLTVNLGPILPLNCAYIDVNNNGSDILDWLRQHRIAVPTGRYGYSGFCRYPEYLFNEQLLREIDADGYGKYLNAQEKHSKQQRPKENETT